MGLTPSRQKSKGLVCNMVIQGRIEKYKADNENLFSTTEAIMVTLMDPDLNQALMPERYRDNPMAGYFALDAEQRARVDGVHQAETKRYQDRQTKTINTIKRIN
jgi:hypothetical protein